MNQGFGKDFYRKGNSVKRLGHSLNRRTLKIEKLLSSSPGRKSALNKVLGGRFRYFLFFCSAEGKGESGATGRGVGSVFD